MLLAVAMPGVKPFAFGAIINGFDPDQHERFLSDESPNPGFLINESQLSGVAIKQAVLITPRHYLAAESACWDCRWGSVSRREPAPEPVIDTTVSPRSPEPTKIKSMPSLGPTVTRSIR